MLCSFILNLKKGSILESKLKTYKDQFLLGKLQCISKTIKNKFYIKPQPSIFEVKIFITAEMKWLLSCSSNFHLLLFVWFCKSKKIFCKQNYIIFNHHLIHSLVEIYDNSKVVNTFGNCLLHPLSKISNGFPSFVMIYFWLGIFGEQWHDFQSILCTYFTFGFHFCPLHCADQNVINL